MANYTIILESKELDLGEGAILGHYLTDALEQLDDLADDLEITPLSDFVSYQQDQLRDESFERQDDVSLERDVEDLADPEFNDLTTDRGFRDTQPDMYYEPDEALEAIQALLEGYARLDEHDENVLDDLRDLNDVFKKVLDANSRFYIQVDEIS